MSARTPLGLPEGPVWWEPAAHADRRPLLLGRNRIKRGLRRWLEGEGFVEVETPCLQVSPGNEAHLHAFATDLRAVDGSVRVVEALMARGETLDYCIVGEPTSAERLADTIKNGRRAARLGTGAGTRGFLRGRAETLRRAQGHSRRQCRDRR